MSAHEKQDSCELLTGNDIACIHCILVLDEAEAIHELDLGDFASAMGLEMGLDIGLGGIAGEVAQIKAGRRNLGHTGLRGPCQRKPSLERDSERVKQSGGSRYRKQSGLSGMRNVTATVKGAKASWQTRLRGGRIPG